VFLPQVQREYLDTQIRGLSNSHVVQPGIKREMVPLVPAHTRIKEIALPLQVCCRGALLLLPPPAAWLVLTSTTEHFTICF
jgi:hypothetical protein